MYKQVKLTQAEQAELRKIQSDATAMLADYDRADKCGIECQPLREGCQEILHIVNNMLTHFGTHHE